MLKNYKYLITLISVFAVFYSFSQNTQGDLRIINLSVNPDVVEVGKSCIVSCYADSKVSIDLKYTCKSSGGAIKESVMAGDFSYTAPSKEGVYDVTMTVSDGKNSTVAVVSVTVVPKGESSPYAKVLFTVDTNTLKNVFVDDSHPSENFKAPLKIKGEMTYDESSGEAQAGGSWPSYAMFDDGSHGDKSANDGIYSLLMTFEKSDKKVHFAFDDASDYRVGFESGITKTLKDNWIDLDEYPEDNTNPAFAPNRDKVVAWDLKMAQKSDSVINIGQLQIDATQADDVVFKWGSFATLYGKKADKYQLLIEGPFADKKSESDLKFTQVLNEGAQNSVTFKKSKFEKGKIYYFKVKGFYNKGQYESKVLTVTF